MRKISKRVKLLILVILTIVFVIVLCLMKRDTALLMLLIGGVTGLYSGWVIVLSPIQTKTKGEKIMTSEAQAKLGPAVRWWWRGLIVLLAVITLATFLVTVVFLAFGILGWGVLAGLVMLVALFLLSFVEDKAGIRAESDPSETTGRTGCVGKDNGFRVNW
ncbi:TPA: hypothetical protein DF272_00590 [Candidatus Falkowbacteria bacterium]|nr:hypothetical protein [Candidatus Falkowbacteria bacterium]